MAKYTGMTFKEIINLAQTLALQMGFKLEYRIIQAVVNEAIMETWIDIDEDLSIYNNTYPSDNKLQLSANGIFRVKHVFGDGTEFTYIPYDLFRAWFIDGIGKQDYDKNIYYSKYGDYIYLEPNLTGYTNLIIHYVPLIEKYTESVADTEPDIPGEYRSLVSYKIIEMLAPVEYKSISMGMYRAKRREVLKQKGRTRAVGTARFYDLYDGSDDYRRGGE